MLTWLVIILSTLAIGFSESRYRTLKSLTGGAGQPNSVDFGDPSRPDFSDGMVRIYTTGGHVLTWQAKGPQTSISRFLQGEPAIYRHLKIYHSDGHTPLQPEKFGEDAWDPTVETYAEFGEVLYAGIMTPTEERSNGIWPDDHWNRRTYAFRKQGTRWVREPLSLFGEVPTDFTWLGHNYGHDFIHLENGDTYVFYERVSEERHGQPFRTEIFARKMQGPFLARKTEIPILRFNGRQWPSARTTVGGWLIEGPRVSHLDDSYLIAFSAGDYASDRYGIHLAWSKNIEGPYRPYLNSHGTDLKDFGEAIEEAIPLTWGAGRPVFFMVDGEWWVVFHGIELTGDARATDELRNIYLAPVEIRARKNRAPDVRIYP